MGPEIKIANYSFVDYELFTAVTDSQRAASRDRLTKAVVVSL